MSFIALLAARQKRPLASFALDVIELASLMGLLLLGKKSVRRLSNCRIASPLRPQCLVRAGRAETGIIHQVPSWTHHLGRWISMRFKISFVRYSKPNHKFASISTLKAQRILSLISAIKPATIHESAWANMYFSSRLS